MSSLLVICLLRMQNFETRNIKKKSTKNKIICSISLIFPRPNVYLIMLLLQQTSNNPKFELNKSTINSNYIKNLNLKNKKNWACGLAWIWHWPSKPGIAGSNPATSVFILIRFFKMQLLNHHTFRRI